jgi:hypothetical protein
MQVRAKFTSSMISESGAMVLIMGILRRAYKHSGPGKKSESRWRDKLPRDKKILGNISFQYMKNEIRHRGQWLVE